MRSSSSRMATRKRSRPTRSKGAWRVARRTVRGSSLNSSASSESTKEAESSSGRTKSAFALPC
eukprot:8563690-Alexandrium_andersonii.AAC.1